jgi:hypothetical protein
MAIKERLKLVRGLASVLWCEVVAPSILIGTIGYAAGIKSGEWFVAYMAAAFTVYYRVTGKPNFDFTIHHNVTIPPGMDPDEFAEAFEGTRFTIQGRPKR